MDFTPQGMSRSKKMIKLIMDEPHKIGHKVGFTDLVEVHKKWIREFVFGKEDYSIQAHRNGYKTSCIALSIVFLMILYPNRKIFYIRKEESKVADVLRTVKNILEIDFIVNIACNIHGLSQDEFYLTKSNSLELQLSICTSTDGTSQLVGRGLFGGITGTHCDIIICDDIITTDDRTSRAEREKTKTIIRELFNIVKIGSSRIIFCGTPWHRDDAWQLMPPPDVYDVHTTGIIPPEDLERIRKKIANNSLFTANYLLKHVAGDDVMFSAAPEFTKDEGLLYNGVGQVDAAYGGADDTAMTIIKKDNKTGRMYGFGKLWKKSAEVNMHNIRREYERLLCGTVYCETNGDKGFLAKEMKKSGIYAVGYHERENKFNKIRDNVGKWWDKITWLEGTDPEYISQIMDYHENATDDDAPDSLASLIRQIEKGSSWGFSKGVSSWKR